METPLRLVPKEPLPEAQSELLIFLFADVRNYTRFTAERGDEVAARLADRFAMVTREAVAGGGGEVIELRGDEALAVFGSARQALRTAVALQARFESESDSDLPLTVGIGIDAGEAVAVQGGYRGGALNLGARLCSLAAAGEVLASEGVIHLARKVEGLHYGERGAVELKGFAEPVRVIQVTAEGRDETTAGDASDGDVVQQLPIGGFLGSLPSSGLVGREIELREVLEAVEAVAGGEGRLVLLAGEPGVGKTRLAQEVTLLAHNYGFLLAVGRCYEPQRAVPFYPFLDALSTLYTLAPSSLRDEAVQRWPYLGRLLPDQLGTAISTSSDIPEEQERLFRAVSGFLTAIAGVRPVALLLDDLHWTDSASLQLVQHLARQTRSSRILILATYRDVDVDAGHPLQAALRDLTREHLATRIPLKRLDRDETSVLIAETFSDMEAGSELSDLVFGHTDGNPFFTQQVLQALIEEGSVFRENGHWRRRSLQDIELPESIRSVITQRMGRLSQATQEVLQEASIFGQAFAFDDLLALKQAGGDSTIEDQLDAALTEAVAMKIVRTAEEEVYAFDHALTQQTLYTGLSPRRRRKLHLAAGEAIESLPERKRKTRTGELAWHFLEANDEERGLRYAVQAGDEAESVFAHGDAEKHYRTALDLIAEGVEPDNAGRSRSDLQEKLGAVLKIRGQYREATDLLQAAAEGYRQAGELEAQARVVARLGAIDGLTGQPERGVARLEPIARELQEQAVGKGVVLVYSELARLYNLTGREVEFLESSERLIELAEGLADERLLAEARLHRGTALMRSGRVDDALPMLEAAITVAERISDLPACCAALSFAAVAYHSQQDFDRAQTYRARSVEVAERLGDPWEISYRAVEAAYGTFLLGDWARSRYFAELALRAALSLDELRMYLQPLYALGELSLYEGEWEDASQYLNEADTIARHLKVEAMIREVEGLRAEMDILGGNFNAALERLAPLLDTAGWEEHLNFLLPLAWAYLEVEDYTRAEDAIRKGMGEAERQRSPVGQIEALRMKGVIASRQHKWEIAGDAFQRGLQRSESIRYTWGEARALYGLGLMYQRKDEPDQSRMYLERADNVFRRLGARAYQDRVNSAQGALEGS